MRGYVRFLAATWGKMSGAELTAGYLNNFQFRILLVPVRRNVFEDESKQPGVWGQEAERW